MPLAPRLSGLALASALLVQAPAGAWAQQTDPAPGDTAPVAGTGVATDLGLKPETEILPGFGQTSTPATTANFSDSELGLPAFLSEGGVLDASNPDLVITLRGGVGVGPAYLGSGDTEVNGDVAARIDFLRFPNGFEFGSGQTVGFRTGLGLRGTARYIGSRNSSHHDELTGLDNIPWAFETGLGLGYEQRNYRVFADVRYGIIGSHAWVGDIGADAIAYPVDGLTLTLGPRLGFTSSRFNDIYFGVSPTESARSGIEAYDPDGGLSSAGVTLGARYLFNDRWGVEGAASWDRLLNDAADSPITENGDDDQYSLTLGLTRRISLDF